MKRIFLVIIAAALMAPLYGQSVGIKTNTLLLGTASPNVGLEVSIGSRASLNIEGSYNPFSFGKDSFWKHWMAQPEIRWWMCHRYAGSFWALNMLFGEYNINNKNWGLDYRYEGSAVGAGIAYGYSWIIANNWNIEAVMGAGYMLMKYDKYDCGNCGEKKGSFKRNYFGPTRVALSLIYYF